MCYHGNLGLSSSALFQRIKFNSVNRLAPRSFPFSHCLSPWALWPTQLSLRSKLHEIKMTHKLFSGIGQQAPNRWLRDLLSEFCHLFHVKKGFSTSALLMFWTGWFFVGQGGVLCILWNPWPLPSRCHSNPCTASTVVLKMLPGIAKCPPGRTITYECEPLKSCKFQGMRHLIKKYRPLMQLSMHSLQSY